ncbi:Hypothetical protein SMAX5B_007047, partial [Scophthalmus maximus]
TRASSRESDSDCPPRGTERNRVRLRLSAERNRVRLQLSAERNRWSERSADEPPKKRQKIGAEIQQQPAGNEESAAD